MRFFISGILAGFALLCITTALSGCSDKDKEAAIAIGKLVLKSCPVQLAKSDSCHSSGSLRIGDSIYSYKLEAIRNLPQGKTKLPAR